MKTTHVIPKAHESEHTLSTDCQCKPAVDPGEVVQLDGGGEYEKCKMVYHKEG